MPPGILETDLETGELMLTAVPIHNDDGEDEMIVNRSHLLTLCALPIDVADAKDHFGLTRQRLEQLAPQVGWLVVRMVSNRIITNLQDANARLQSWVPYLTQHTHKIIMDRMKRYLQ